MYNRRAPTTEARLSADEAGFRPEHSYTEQVASVRMFIENWFQKGFKTAAVYFDLSLAYGTRFGHMAYIRTNIPIENIRYAA